MSEELECTRCGDAWGDVDEATEFCPDCYESEMGEPSPFNPFEGLGLAEKE